MGTRDPKIITNKYRENFYEKKHLYLIFGLMALNLSVLIQTSLGMTDHEDKENVEPVSRIIHVNASPPRPVLKPLNGSEGSLSPSKRGDLRIREDNPERMKILAPEQTLVTYGRGSQELIFFGERN